MRKILIFLLSILSFLLGAHFLSNPTNDQKVLFKKFQIDDQKEWVSNLCEGKQICAKYHQIRLDCSISSDFNNCVQIRSEEIKSFFYPYLCADDGTVLTINQNNEKVVLNEIPSDTQCRFNAYRIFK